MTARHDKDMAKAIHDAAVDVNRGGYDAEFPLDVFQTGSGTSSNMNMNEVLASLASERLGRPVHPNDDVNVSQSSNDVFPSAIHLASVRSTTRSVVALARPADRSIAQEVGAFASVVKSGRTHLMDATPVTLGQEFGGYASQVKDARDRIETALPTVGVLPLGGTAVGTGINAPRTFARSVIKRLAQDMDLPLSEAKDHFAAEGARELLVGISGDLRRSRSPHKDRERPAVDGIRPAGRLGRDPHTRSAAGLVDHAGQGQPRHLRSGHAGVRGGDGQRRGDRVRRVTRQLRVERVPAGDRPKLARVDPSSGRACALFCLPTGASPASKPTSTG